MAATDSRGDTATTATPPAWLGALDAFAEERGITTEVGKAALLDVDITTLWRYRQGMKPRLEKAIAIAETIGIPVERVAS
jgi:hypothetical protein